MSTTEYPYASRTMSSMGDEEFEAKYHATVLNIINKANDEWTNNGGGKVVYMSLSQTEVPKRRGMKKGRSVLDVSNALVKLTDLNRWNGSEFKTAAVKRQTVALLKEIHQWLSAYIRYSHPVSIGLYAELRYDRHHLSVESHQFNLHQILSVPDRSLRVMVSLAVTCDLIITNITGIDEFKELNVPNTAPPTNSHETISNLRDFINASIPVPNVNQRVNMRWDSLSPNTVPVHNAELYTEEERQTIMNKWTADLKDSESPGVPNYFERQSHFFKPRLKSETASGADQVMSYKVYLDLSQRIVDQYNKYVDTYESQELITQSLILSDILDGVVSSMRITAISTNAERAKCFVKLTTGFNAVSYGIVEYAESASAMTTYSTCVQEASVLTIEQLRTFLLDSFKESTFPVSGGSSVLAVYGELLKRHHTSPKEK